MNSNKKLLFSDKALLYLALIALICNMVYWVFPFRPIVWRMLFVLCSVDVIAFRRGRLTGLEKSVLCFAILNFAYFVFSLTSLTPDYGQIGNILVALLSLSFFTHMGEQGLLNSRFVAFASIVLIIGSIFQYNHAEKTVLMELDVEATTVNATATFLMILPLLMLVRNDILKTSGFIICLLYIITGAKRGNILAAVIPSVLFVLLLMKGKERKSILRTLFVIMILVCAAVFLYNKFLANDYLMHRLELTAQGNTSGRDVIYAHAWEAWSKSDSMMNLVFGYGFNGTIHHPLMNGMHAHNDWLEIIVDYGLTGTLLYLFVFLFFFKTIHLTKDFGSKMLLLSAVFIWLFKTAYSMGFTEPSLSILFISVGAILGQQQAEKNASS